MEIRMFQRTWHGIDLTTLPAAFVDPAKPVSSEFYAQFYAKLAAGQGKIESHWLQAKRSLGESIERDIIAPWRIQHHRSPHILALGAGAAAAERIWYERDHAVTFHDCQEDSLADTRRTCPRAGFLVGSFDEIAPTDRYDLITMLTIDYVMDHKEFVAFLARSARWLAPNGQLIIYCASTLSFRQLAVETVKRALGRYRNQQQVFWGYWRTPREFFRAARSAGLRLVDIYRFGTTLHKAGAATRALPPLRDTNLIFTLEKKA